MTTDDALLDALAADLTPVRRRSLARDLIVCAALAALELALYVALRGGMRPDMAAAITRMTFWWKAGGLLGLAVIGVATTMMALDPARSPRRGLRIFAAAAAAVAVAGWALDAAHGSGATLVARLDWRQGIDCVVAVVVLSLPALAALIVLMRRGAATDAPASALAAGIAAAAWGGTVFTVACPSDDPLYVVVWFTVAIVIVAATARAVVPRLIRW